LLFSQIHTFQVNGTACAFRDIQEYDGQSHSVRKGSLSRSDQNVIKVDTYHSFHDEVLEYVIHHCLEGSWAIGESKEHHQGLEQPSVGLKCGLPLIAFLDSNIVVALSNI